MSGSPKLYDRVSGREAGRAGTGEVKKRSPVRRAPTDFMSSKRLQGRFLAAYEKVLVVRHAARHVGVTPSTVYRCRANDEEFRAKFDEIHGYITTMGLEDAAIDEAIIRRSPKLMTFLLEGRDKKYAKRVDHNVAHNGTVSLRIGGLEAPKEKEGETIDHEPRSLDRDES